MTTFNESISLIISYKFHRRGPIGKEEIDDYQEIDLNMQKRIELANVIGATTSSTLYLTDTYTPFILNRASKLMYDLYIIITDIVSIEV